MNRIIEPRLEARLLAVVLFMGLILSPSPLLGEEQYATGNMFQQMSQVMRIAYIEGFREGLRLAFFHPNPTDPPLDASKILKCISGMPNSQVLSIVSQDIASHPAEWHLPLMLLTGGALSDACP
jgi:hypothetical protein